VAGGQPVFINKFPGKSDPEKTPYIDEVRINPDFAGYSHH
jgi:hypothetical protein